MGSDTAIVVLSCAWGNHPRTRNPWVWLHARHWPDCPWPVHWIEDTIRGRAWGDFVVEAMSQVDARVVLVTMNDMVACAPTDTAEVVRCRDEMEAIGAAYYRICPTPECTTPFAHGHAGTHAIAAPYAKSLYPAFWRPTYLTMQAAGVGDPWSFELSPVRDPVGLHCAVTRENRPYSIVEMLKRGQWTDDGRRVLTELGLPIPTEGA
ncbi:MAG: hypothetical protein Q8O71_01655 [bacterium]|nr:hypothetical protein [bacterium]